MLPTGIWLAKLSQEAALSANALFVYLFPFRIPDKTYHTQKEPLHIGYVPLQNFD